LFPRLGIVAYICFTIAVFILGDPWILLIASAIFLFLIIVLPYRKLRSGIVPISLFLSVTFVANLLFNTGKIVYKLGPFIITEEGLQLASVRTMRVFLLVAGAKFLTILSTLDEIIVAMGMLLNPLEKLGLPVRSFFDSMALSVKVLPLIKQRISDEYNARVQEADDSSIKKKASIVRQFLLPVFFESIHNPEAFLADKSDGHEHGS
jgi:energy-coupling factor transport system permease protein